MYTTQYIAVGTKITWFQIQQQKGQLVVKKEMHLAQYVHLSFYVENVPILDSNPGRGKTV